MDLGPSFVKLGQNRLDAARRHPRGLDRRAEEAPGRGEPARVRAKSARGRGVARRALERSTRASTTSRSPPRRSGRCTAPCFVIPTARRTSSSRCSAPASAHRRPRPRALPHARRRSSSGPSPSRRSTRRSRWSISSIARSRASSTSAGGRARPEVRAKLRGQRRARASPRSTRGVEQAGAHARVLARQEGLRRDRDHGHEGPAIAKTGDRRRHQDDLRGRLLPRRSAPRQHPHLGHAARRRSSASSTSAWSAASRPRCATRPST